MPTASIRTVSGTRTFFWRYAMPTIVRAVSCGTSKETDADPGWSMLRVVQWPDNGGEDYGVRVQGPQPAEAQVRPNELSGYDDADQQPDDAPDHGHDRESLHYDIVISHGNERAIFRQR